MKKPTPRSKSAARRAAPASSAKKGASTTFDTGLVEQLAEIISKHDLSEVMVEENGFRVRVARQPAPIPPAVTVLPTPPGATTVNVSPIAAPTPAATAPEEHPGVVKSPMVGTAYLRASPDAKPFIEIGAAVKPGDKLLLVEAMKTFNEIVAPRGGTVTSIFVDDGKPVEYGEPLLVIE